MRTELLLLGLCVALQHTIMDALHSSTALRRRSLSRSVSMKAEMFCQACRML